MPESMAQKQSAMVGNYSRDAEPVVSSSVAIILGGMKIWESGKCNKILGLLAI